MFTSTFFFFFSEIFFICFVLFLLSWAVLFVHADGKKGIFTFFPTFSALYLSMIGALIGFGGFIFFFDEFFQNFNILEVNGYKLFILILFVFLLFFLWSSSYYENISFEYIILLNLVIFSSFLMLNSLDFLSFYIALEIQSLSLYVLVASARDSVLAAEAGIKYFVLGAFSTSLFLLGLSYIYFYVGSLDFLVIATVMSLFQGSSFLIFAFFLMLSLFMFKLAIVPFHAWSPDVYQGATSYTSSILMILPKTVFFFVLLKILFFFKQIFLVPEFFFVFSVLSLLVGGFFAIFQFKIRRLLAFSSVTNFGFIFLALGSLSFYSLYSVLLYFYVYLFGLISFFCLYFSVRKVNKGESMFLDSISDFAGLYQSYPLLSVAFAINIFSFAGIPPLAGFFGKFFLLSALLFSKMFFFSFIFLMATVLTAVYYLYLIKQMFFFAFIKNYIITDFYLLLIGIILSLVNSCFIFFFDLWYFLCWF